MIILSGASRKYYVANFPSEVAEAIYDCCYDWVKDPKWTGLSDGTPCEFFHSNSEAAQALFAELAESGEYGDVCQFIADGDVIYGDFVNVPQYANLLNFPKNLKEVLDNQMSLW